ncbi:ATP-binding protein [Actinomycetospora endophytica]|uniref:histidine kinase n=1 Tax=Actinomycetospora endophytica TaxID=2291215 RepID=A0ABS8PCD9_9PSEU|nr:ATP-binding protein [Actinomycetospora endophytica]MCD2195938.1 ATP-binding protein [Actinomycetospora endophytica]
MDRADEELFHDIGHELATLSLLVASVRAERGLAGAVSERMALIEGEIDRLRVLVGTGGGGGGPGDAVLLREQLAGIVAARAVGTTTSVALLPGPEVARRVDTCLLDRVVTNLLDNAIRAAGPAGHVEVELSAGPPVTVRVLDDGPGPGRGPGGRSGRGLAIVGSVAERLGATVTLRPGRGAGTVAEVVLDDRLCPAVPTPRGSGE